MKFVVSALISTAAVVLAAPVPDPPGIPTEAAARTQLAGLTVSEPTNEDTYDRDLFPHWSGVSGNCNAREFVLERDGDDVVTDNSCVSTSGSWTSPYDGATWDATSDVDIDHMVPLKNAWISGAADWTTDEREGFANDITRPQLWAVTDEVNQSKSDQSPDEWKPPLESFYCIYARAWIQVKSYYELTITDAEESALTDMLDTC